MKTPISIIILTFNEEIHIERCLKSIASLAREIIIVDSFSTDKTLEIAKKYNVKIFQHQFENYTKQFNWVLDNLPIQNEWILRLDADEYLTKELEEEIKTILPEIKNNINGFFMKRQVYFMGRWIRHGGYYPVWLLRLFRRGKGRCEEREMDEHIFLDNGCTIKLQNDFVDDNRKSITWWIDKHNSYSVREAKDMMKSGVPDKKELSGIGEQPAQKRWMKKNIYMKFPIFLRAFLYFFYRYFIRLGFLDGKEGLIFHFLQGFWYRFLVDAKLYESRK